MERKRPASQFNFNGQAVACSINLINYYTADIHILLCLSNFPVMYQSELLVYMHKLYHTSLRLLVIYIKIAYVLLVYTIESVNFLHC